MKASLIYLTLLIQSTGGLTNKEISEDEAKSIALKIVPGKIIEVEREKYKGESVFSVEIRSNTSFHEVIISIATGKVIADKVKDHDDDDEKDDEHK